LPAFQLRAGPSTLPDFGQSNLLIDAMTRFQMTFGALIFTQAVHSFEEYRGRLWESFPPAQFLSALVSPDLRASFLMLNILLVGFGIWCFVWPVLRQWRIAIGVAWFWIVIEIINGIVHPLWSLSQFAYTPGLMTAPVLLTLAIYLMTQLRSAKR
jgi:hypothetical protein